jgi:hypothetical protein
VRFIELLTTTGRQVRVPRTDIFMLDAHYVSTLAALAGTLVGAITSIISSWLATHRQSRDQRVQRERSELKSIYEQFIRTVEHNSAEIAKFSDLYATLNRIRVVSSSHVIKAAEESVCAIVERYPKKNKSFSEITSTFSTDFQDPLRLFSEACHRELAGLENSGRQFVSAQRRRPNESVSRLSPVNTAYIRIPMPHQQSAVEKK